MEKGFISSVPRIDRVSLRDVKHKGILTIAEASKLFQHKNWTDDRARIICMLASCTGMRAGELLALQIKDFHITENGKAYIDINRSWNRAENKMNKTTKTGKARRVVIPDRMRMEIEFLIKKNPHIEKEGESAFIFFAQDLSDKPFRHEKITDFFHDALEVSGIKEAERRNITFHSWRYFFNSILINSKIPIQKVQSVTGHTTLEMSQHYYVSSIEDMSDIRQIQDDSLRNCFVYNGLVSGCEAKKLTKNTDLLL